jgi:flagellar secretion chaperone FliS
MQAATARASAAYQATQVQSCSPLEQVVLLYNGVIQFLTKARDAMTQGNLPLRHRGISQSLAIINYLQSTLNLNEGGEIATRLDALYTYVRERILEANMTHQAAPLDECLSLLNTLREGWAQIAAAPQGPVPVDRGRV